MVSIHYRIAGRTSTEIVESVEGAVRDGLLAPNDRLPPVRALAQELGVAAGTVAAAYRALGEHGVVSAEGRRGTTVRARPTVAARVAPRDPLPDGVRDLASGHPDPLLLPRLATALASLPGGPAPAPALPLLPELADLARERLRGDGVPADDLAVTAGTLDGIQRVLAAHLRPGDRVAMEDPAWPNALDLLAALGLHAVPVPIDDQGMRADRLAAVLDAGARAVIVTARAQNPTGAAVTPGRAAQLREVLAARPGVLLVEDDHSAELSEVPLAPLAGAGGSWAFLRSTSKPYGPDLRLAVLAADPVTAGRVQGRQRAAGWVSTLLQRLVVQMWRDPATDAAVHHAALTYARRRDGLVAELAARGVPAHGRTGINVWVPLPAGRRGAEAAAVARLAAAGWAVAPGTRFTLDGAQGLRITVSGLQDGDLPRLAGDVTTAVGAGDGDREGPRGPSY